MMVRDHFAKCTEIPEDIRQEYLTFKGKNSQGACDSRHYWLYAAKKLGMIETGNGKGIEMSQATITKAQEMPSYGYDSVENGKEVSKALKKKAEAKKEDLALLPKEPLEGATPFLKEFLSHLQVVHLLPAERVGKRKTLPLGLEGFGCRYCYKVDRLGFSRCYPLRRRGLPAQVYDMYVHLQRCTVCPKEVKARLKQLEPPAPAAAAAPTGKKASKTNYLFSGSSALTCGNSQKDIEFMDMVWKRLGRSSDLTT